MLRFQLPTDEIDYLHLAFPASGAGLVACWGTQIPAFTVAAWDGPDTPPTWRLSDDQLNLSPDGEWVSAYDEFAGQVRVTRVGAEKPFAVVDRARDADNVWTAVAPGGTAAAWKDDPFAVVRALPGGEPVARVKSGWGVDLRFSPGGRWLTEMGERVFRVFDRADNYRVFARIKTPRYSQAEFTDGLTAVAIAPDVNTVSVRDLSDPSATVTLPVGAAVSALAVSPDGRLVLTATTGGGVTLWDAAGGRIRQYNWGVNPIATAFARDGLRAAVGGADGRVVVWDLDD